MHKEPAADLASVLTATAVWPFPADDRAPAALRGQLRELNLNLHQAAGGQPGDVPVLDWTTLTVGPPETDTDHRGRVWFHYTATVSTHPCCGAPTASPDRGGAAGHAAILGLGRPSSLACGQCAAS